MKRTLCIVLGLAWLAAPGGRVDAVEAVPLGFQQDAITFNLESVRGMPISTVFTNGSDGRMPATNSSYGSFNPPTARQFAGVVSFGAVTAPPDWRAMSNQVVLRSGTNTYASVVAAMQVPVGRTNGDADNSICIVLRRSVVGVPYLNRQVSFNFGSIIPVPNSDENGVTLGAGIAKESYWLPEPWSASNHTNDQYYWSPNAGAVFAVQPGPIAVTWRKAAAYPLSSIPAYTNVNGTQSFLTNGGNVFELYTARYIVSGSAVKTPRKIYWTEGTFQNIGWSVAVPPARVSAIHVVYNPLFPEYVDQPYSDPNTVDHPGSSTNSFQEYRTLWMDTVGQVSHLHAYNVEGRVFVELLGTPVPGGSTRQFLGFEIVDVYRYPIPSDVSIDLGERLTAFQDGSDDSYLTPQPIQNSGGQQFYYSQQSLGVLYANRKTENINDLQVHWLIAGVAGLEWPHLFVRYHNDWPLDPARYSHYVRPPASSPSEAALTAVQLPANEAPVLDDQDALDQQRGFLQPTGLFYTWLDQAHPAHRSLIRFMSGDNVRFERVFSWLDAGLKTNSLLAGSVATNLTGWDTNTLKFTFANSASTPYVLALPVQVGDRINPPPGELGSTGDYWAGAIRQTNGNSFNPHAYIDPFVAGFDAANQGAIIPVNSIPGRNLLEVWWFRRNSADPARGFQSVYWPSVIGRYTINWPSGAPEIIMADNSGTGGLDSLRQKGSIYYQNDPALPGYNPNEEHAVMLGGQAYALRDDLNITSGPNYSSAPYVLIDYTESDGRPAMSVFKVRREKPEAGVLFDYIVKAGSMLQPPAPLQLLQAPVEGSGANTTNYDTEPQDSSGDLPPGWVAAYNNSPFERYKRFTFEDRKHNFWVYRGPHAGLPPFQAGAYNLALGKFDSLPPATAVVGQPFRCFVHVSRQIDSLTIATVGAPLPDGLAFDGMSISGVPLTPGSNTLTLSIQDTADGSTIQLPLSLSIVTSGSRSALGPLQITSTNQYSGTMVTYVDRPPQLAAAPVVSNSFTMRFYYKTLPGFAWPGYASPPAVGSIVPYLRKSDGAGGFLGDPTDKHTLSQNIVYRPVWPELDDKQQPLPTVFAGQTLTASYHGLPAIRAQSSLEVLYQESIGTNIAAGAAAASVILHDPTVRKSSSLVAIGGVPASVLSASSQGKTYFQNLPPNLVNRLYFDPNSTNLVLEGQFIDDIVGEKYLLLNVLAGADLAAAQGLCAIADPNYSAWADAVLKLSAPVYSFYEDPAVPGSYVVNPTQTVYRNATNLVAITNSDSAVDSYALTAAGPGQGYVTFIAGNGHNPAHASEPISVYIVRVAPPLFRGQIKVLDPPSPLSEMISFQHTPDLAARTFAYQYDWRIAPPVDGQPPTSDPVTWTPLASGTDLGHVTLGGSGIQSLSDNYVTVRYRCIDPLAPPGITNWSEWTDSQLAEGWIKRVLAGINPFNQRTTDLFDNPANTTASIISQAGHRWEGDVPLNMDALTKAGLIEIYETVLNRGKALSINAGYNYGPANDALLLAAGYLNDLYMLLGNDAWADAANPTIGIGTADKTYGNIATALFAFKGQEPSLLDEELALLRGRDDFLAPGVRLNPVYNRLFWNYTRGIDSGEVIYALNYNILDQNGDGVVNAADAAAMFPQGHGDAYGHYLTALKNYYSLLMNPHFSWVPRIEAVTVLGATVSVDYLDERKFAAAAAALARSGRQIVDLTWRQTYQPAGGQGWKTFEAVDVNAQHTYTNAGVPVNVTRYWGLDHWASRAGQAAYVNWIVGSAILPAHDTDPNHQGIQKIDRSTVPELSELPQTASAMQIDMDNANAGFTPLGLSRESIPFDINPLQVAGNEPHTHFEQVYDRAVTALNNAVVAFDDAQNVTQMMRSEEDSLADFQAGVDQQEAAYNSSLIEIYGTPYPGDMGPGKTYSQDYSGPDLIHYTYVENPDTNTWGGILSDPRATITFKVDTQKLPADWSSNMYENVNFITNSTSASYTNTDYVTFTLGPNGYFNKPADWTVPRVSPGSIQQAISTVIAAQNRLRQELSDAQGDKQTLDKAVNAFNAQMNTASSTVTTQNLISQDQYHINHMQYTFNMIDKWMVYAQQVVQDQITLLGTAVPTENIFGIAVGGDQVKAALTGAVIGLDVVKEVFGAADAIAYSAIQSDIDSTQSAINDLTKTINNNQYHLGLQNAAMSVASQLSVVQSHLSKINQELRDLDDAQAAYRALVAQGSRIQQERLTFRQHAAAVVQGYRTRDAAFRIFQNEKLERYQTLFTLAARYAFMAANAYDYETGLLNSSQGQAFLARIISSRALGVVQNGVPQYAGSDTGDPGLSSALAEMKADWDVLKGRLGFNNPDGYGTVVSLRAENYRILSGADGDDNWKKVLLLGRRDNLLADSDVRRYCMQIDDGTGVAVPGIVLNFRTTIEDGLNLFGQSLSPGDHSFSSSSFATRIFSIGVDFDGYIGMANPVGGVSPTDPTLDPNALAATPYCYLIPVGTDFMRSPPLGDVSVIRAWNVEDLTIPLPFNISASDFSATPLFTSSDSLTEPLLAVRKHQAFRPVSTDAAFNTSIYGATGSLQPSQYTNKRLIGRSAWNSQWKLVIPGKTLLDDPRQGLDRFINSVRDVKLYFVTYSYSGN